MTHRPLGALDHDAVRGWLEKQVGGAFAPTPECSVGGGSINQCVRWRGSAATIFLKCAPVDRLAMFEAEAAGLAELADAAALRVPRVLGTGTAGAHALLALEWLDLRPAELRESAQSRLGSLLAAQHRVTAAAFGWSRDNTIGATPQPNGWHTDWVRFFVERRLAHQLTLAAHGDASDQRKGLRNRSGLDRRVIDRGHLLLERCGAFFSSYRPVPSLLHGDLWGGNWAVDAGSGEPVIFDPAVYYGDRETDIAMTKLFGGFGPGFYAAYQSEWPLDQAAGTRRNFYNLYHVLNHHNLFGGGYGAQAATMIDGLLAEFG